MDESQPQYWVAKLDDAEWRARAIRRLSLLFEDLVTQTNQDRTHPEVRAFVQEVLPPLSRTYLEHRAVLEDKVRAEAVSMLAGFQDPRVAPALEQVFIDFARTGARPVELKWACRAVRDLKLTSVRGALFQAFERFRPSTPEGAYYRDVNEALLAVADPAWSPTLLTLVDANMPVLDARKQPSQDELAAFRDQVYRTVTAAQLLGELRDAKATRSLIRLVLDPERVVAADEAMRALMNIGKPAAEAAIALMNGSDAELVAYQKERSKRLGAARPGTLQPVADAATILAAIGRSEGIAPILAALRAAKSDDEKARLLWALALLPHTPEVTQAFKDGFERLSTKARYGDEIALVPLSESAASFFDPSFTEVLVKKARALKRDKVAMSMVTRTAMKTMNESQLAEVRALVDELHPGGLEPTKEAYLEDLPREFELAEGIVRKCRTNPACHLEETRHGGQETTTRIRGLTALQQFGQFSRPEMAEQLIESLGWLEEAHLRYAAAKVLEHHHPNGSLEVAEKLGLIVERNLASVDREKAANDAGLRQTMVRLRVRVQAP